MAFNVLIVDDSSTIRAVIRRTLELAGVSTNEVYQAANGLEALEVLRNSWVDIVFSDVNMPEMNGQELLERMQLDDTFEKIPVIMVTTEGSLNRIKQLKASGMKAYIRKPFTPERLSEVVKEVMGNENERQLLHPASQESART